MSPQEFGKIAIFETLLLGLAGVVGVNSIGASVRRYYDESNSDISNYNGACFIILVISTIPLVIFVSLFDEFTSRVIGISVEWILLCILSAFLTYITLFRLSQWQIRNMAIKYGMFQVGRTLLNFAITILLIVYLNNDGSGRVLGYVTSLTLFGLISFVFMFRSELIKFSNLKKQHFIDILSFGVPLIPHVFGIFLISSVDRFAINSFLGHDDVGIYMSAVQFSMGLSIFFNAINKAFVPYLFNVLKENKIESKKALVVKTYQYYFVLFLITVVMYFFSEPLFKIIIDEKFHSASSLVFIILLGHVFNGMYLMVTNYVFFSKKTGRLSLITITTGFLNVWLLFYFIPVMGILGAALSYCISKLIQFVCTWIISCYVCPMPWLKFKESKNA